MRSIGAIIYLGIFASLIGFLGYFYILQKLNATTVALITLMTPPLAITLGALINNEPVGPNLFIGAFFVIVGLALYQVGGWRIKMK